MLHRCGNLRSAPGFCLGGIGNGRNTLREILRDTGDFRQRLACGIRQVRAGDDALDRVFHGGYSVMGVRLNGPDQRGYLLGGCAGAFRQALHFFGHHRKATAGFPGRGGLDGGIQRQYIGLFGDVGNEVDNFADFLRGFTQAFDAFRGFLYLAADFMHAGNRGSNCLRTFLCDID